MVLGPSGRLFSSAASVCAFLIASSVAPPPARGECRIAEFQFNPVSRLQIAIWVEDAQGNYVDTVYVTRATATLGLGNRPGRMDFNSEVLWPYGRRENVLPIWAHRRGIVYPRVVYQDGDDNDLSHAIEDSSLDPYYCRPLRAGEHSWEQTIDSGSCATTAYTDKGKLSTTTTSLYPPRNDLDVRQAGDTDDMMSYGDLNGLDAISRATPLGGRTVAVRWAVPNHLPAGEYVAWIEVSRESDFNAAYNPTSYPSPLGLAWSEYGHPYRGQPSIAWRLPFVVGTEPQRSGTEAYAGYGDPDGVDGRLNPPDDSITTVAGTYSVPAGQGGNPPARTVDDLGVARLQLETAPEGDYRFRVDFRAEHDEVPPAPPFNLEVRQVFAGAASLTFKSPGDDGLEGRVAEYEIRYGAGEPPADGPGFERGQRVDDLVHPAVAASTEEVGLSGLQPSTHCWVGVRAQDDCLNASPIVYARFTTPAAVPLAVDACFVATAAWGSLLEAHVADLRGFRDRMLRTQALGEILVEAYYTFGPALADIIRPSDSLRALARDALDPVVARVRSIRYVSGVRTR